MKVIIIGCGISGPVLGMLLKHIGHEPVIYERHPEPSNGGITLQLTPQTMKVLRILDLDKKAMATGMPIEKLITRSEVSGEILFQDDHAMKELNEKLGYPVMCSVDRPAYGRMLAEEAQKRGIPVHFGKRAVDVKQDEKTATVVFEDGSTDTGDILVGCDGLHSAVRDAVFGKVEPEYTGISVVAGMSSIPPPNLDPTWGTQIFGEGAHMFYVQTAADHLCFGCTYADPVPSKEDWRKASREQVLELIKEIPQSKWSGGAGEVLKHVISAVKFGMYLRPILPVWHKGRAVLCGDAAHPTAPYIGQGANQSTEDCYHLVRLLKNSSSPSLNQLEEAFTQYEALRYPRVVKAVEQATQEGKFRVMQGREACLQRDAMVAQGMKTQSWQVIMEMTKGPFEGESEI